MGNRCHGCKYQGLAAVDPPCGFCCGNAEAAERRQEIAEGWAPAPVLFRETDADPGGYRAALAAGHSRRTQPFDGREGVVVGNGCGTEVFSRYAQGVRDGLIR